MRESADRDYVRLAKNVARKMYDKGVAIYLLPSNVTNFHGMWVQAIPIEKGESEEKFDPRVFGFEYYNCCPQLGKQATFYIKVKKENE